MCNLLEPRSHDELLNYRLKRLVSVGGAPAIRLCEGRYGVARSEWRLVAALVEHGSMSPRTLSAKADVEFPRVSRLLTGLMAKRLVQRTEPEGDRRAAVVKATLAGEKLYRELFPQLAAINRRITQVLSREEAAIFDACLEKLTRQACDIRDSGGGVSVKTNRSSGGSRRFWPA